MVVAGQKLRLSADVGGAGIDDAIVSAVLDLGHSTDLTIVAEGTETLAAYRRLSARGCDRGQGHLMAPATPADELSFAPFDPGVA